MTEKNAPETPEVVVITSVPDPIESAPKKSFLTKKRIAIAGAATTAAVVAIVLKARKGNKETDLTDDTDETTSLQSETDAQSDAPVSE